MVCIIPSVPFYVLVPCNLAVVHDTYSSRTSPKQVGAGGEV